MQWLKQSTAVTLKIGPFVDDTNGKTAETGLTIAQADVRLSKNGANIAQKNESTSCTHDELGIYGCPLDTTDTATLGRLQLWVHESGALPVWHEFMVVPANVWDSFFGTDMLKVDVHSIDDDETAANNLESYCDGTTPIPANATQISADATAADNLELITEIANITSLTVDAAGHLEANVVEIEGADPTDQINTAVDAALNTAIPGSPTAHSINQRIKALDELTEASGTGDLTAILGDTNELQTDDIPGAISGLNDPTAATVADAVWDEGSTGHVDAGKAGQQLWTDLDAVLADTGTDGVVLADNAITAAKIVAAAANKIADHIIRRSFVNACDSSDGDAKSFRSLLGAVAKLVNKIAVSGSTLTVYEEDDTTSLGTQAITTDSGADPITALDTA